MEKVTNPVDSGQTLSQQDIKKLLSAKMPGKESDFSQWETYNGQQYAILLISNATEEDRKSALENLVNANMALFFKRAKAEKRMNCGLEFDDVVQTELLNFVEAINKAAKSGVPEFPAEYAFDKFNYKKDIWENYSPCGIKMSYTTKKRRVASNTYNMHRVTFMEEATEAIVSQPKFAKQENRKDIMKDSELFGSLWMEELKDGLNAVLSELSDVESGILTGIAKGFSNVKIANNLGISESSVRRYATRMQTKVRMLAIANGLDAYIHDIYA